ncbi:MAG: TonB family protein [Gemmatimonadaceae bacterium]
MARAAPARHASVDMWRLDPAVLVLGIVLPRASAAQSAQPVGAVSGVVADSAGLPIAGAEIVALGSGAAVRSSETGQFRIGAIALGPALLVARRLGFRPETLAVVVAPAEASVHFALGSLPTLLEAVAVSSRRRFTGRLAGYYERLAARTQGYFITRDDIDRGNPRQLTDVLRRAPGVEIVRGSRLRLRGRNCAPLVWIDGVSMPAGEVELNTFAPSSLEGIEIYMTASGAPGRYQATGDESRCGTVLLWSRGRDTEERRAPVASAAEWIEKLHAAGEVATASEVDSAARLDGSAAVVVYPPDLFVAGIGGVVVAEFVVDTTGHVEPETFSVVSSPHLLFSHAVYEAIAPAQFTAASRAGHRVRQVVQMRFRFAPPGAREQ